jgi:hypothetical protein
VTTTAKRVATLLFLGAPLHDEAKVAHALLKAQSPLGGWPDPTGEPTLQATYQVLRALRLLSAQPDELRVNAFVASCRQPEGGYAPSPHGFDPAARTAQVGLLNTYFALTIDRWINEPDASGIS